MIFLLLLLFKASRRFYVFLLMSVMLVLSMYVFFNIYKTIIHFLFFRSALQRIWSVPCHISGLAVKNQALILLSIGLMVPDLYLNGQILAELGDPNPITEKETKTVLQS